MGAVDAPAEPPLPEPLSAETLREMDEAALDDMAAQLAAAERTVRTAMAPFERQLRTLRERTAVLATERRRRERAQRHAARVAVREAAGSERMPALGDALAAEPSPLADGLPLGELTAHLRT